jgi:hypothetical protein
MLAAALTLALFGLFTLVVDMIRRDGRKISAALRAVPRSPSRASGRPVTVRFSPRCTAAAPAPTWQPRLRAAAGWLVAGNAERQRQIDDRDGQQCHPRRIEQRRTTAPRQPAQTGASRRMRSTPCVGRDAGNHQQGDEQGPGNTSCAVE